MTAPVRFSSAPPPGAWMIGAVLLLLAAGAGVAYVGTREPAGDDEPWALTRPGAAEVRTLARPGSAGIELPQEAFPVPYGGHREVFIASCTQCHSARLVFTQPRFPAKTWTTVVAKMVNAYQAPLSPEEQSQIVAYLSGVHGDGPEAAR